MELSWVWSISALLLMALVAGLAWAQVQRRLATARRTDVDWPAAILLELTVIGTALENVMLAGIAYTGPPGARLTAALLPAAAVSVAGFAVSIALLALHRRHAPRRAATFLWRRIGVATPGVVGFAALTSITAAIVTEVGRALPPAVLAGPALTTLLGIALATHVFSVARVPHQRNPGDPQRPTAPAEKPDEHATPGTIAVTTGPHPDNWDPYRRPTSQV